MGRGKLAPSSKNEITILFPIQPITISTVVDSSLYAKWEEGYCSTDSTSISILCGDIIVICLYVSTKLTRTVPSSV